MLQIFAEDPQSDRRRILNEAQRARARRRFRRAIALYQEALAAEPDNYEIVSRLAPLLAFDGRHFEAWRYFRAAGQALLRDKHPEWALALFREASHCLPHEFDAWRVSSEIERKLGRVDLAYETLLTGRNHFRSPIHRDQAVALLELARRIEPWDPVVVIDLAGLLARTDRVDRALALLERYADRCARCDLAKVRAAQWRITWSPHHAWQWLSALLPSTRVQAKELHASDSNWS
jgi:tetratricopeptide (TPR) repeat protein